MTSLHRLAGAALAGLLLAPAFTASAAPAVPDPRIAEAFIYAFPVFEEARIRWGATHVADPQHPVVNRFQHARDLAGPASRGVTTPNNDTLYSSAFLDLAAGPVALSTPDFGDRYWSVTFMDAYTNNFSTLGRRTTGDAPQRYWLVGPSWRGAAPKGVTLIRAPGDWVWALARIVVQGPDDLAKARELQAGLELTAQTQTPSKATLRPVKQDAANFIAVVNEALAANPPPPADAPELARIAAVGIGPGVAPPTPALLEAWSRDLPVVEQELGARARTARPSEAAGGWSLPARGVGEFGTNYGLRAGVALTGLAALEPAEAVYLAPISDQAGEPLDSSRRYVFHLTKDLPIDAFWSLSAYQQAQDSRLFFAENPIHRYAIGDRTPGLVRNADGSLDVYLQHDAPTDPKAAANWLPLPEGPVRLTLRLYQPRAEVISGAYRPAALVRQP